MVISSIFLCVPWFCARTRQKPAQTHTHIASRGVESCHTHTFIAVAPCVCVSLRVCECPWGHAKSVYFDIIVSDSHTHTQTQRTRPKRTHGGLKTDYNIIYWTTRFMPTCGFCLHTDARGEDPGSSMPE